MLRRFNEDLKNRVSLRTSELRKEKKEHRTNETSVLIVDDNWSVRERLAEYLAADYVTYTASNGVEAVEIMRDRDDIDIILSDLKMPDMDGIELLEKLNVRENGLLVIIITGVSSIESVVEAMRKGAYDYLKKPVDLTKLKITIKNAIENIKIRSKNRIRKQRIEKEFVIKSLVGRSEQIRDLMNCIESNVVMSVEDEKTAESLLPYFSLKQEPSKGKLFYIEKNTILSTLEETGGNKTEAAKILGIGLRTLYRKLEQYELLSVHY